MQAVIFDMDGLMVDSEKIWNEAWEQAFSQHGLVLLPGVIESCLGSSYERSLDIVNKAYEGALEPLEAFEDHFKIANAMFLAHGAPKKPGLDDLLSWLSDSFIPCAVASSSPRSVVEVILRRIGIFSAFQVVKTGDEGFPSKPAPDIFLAAANNLGVRPEKTFVIEDSPSGIEAACYGGFIPIMVPDLVEPDDKLRSRCAHVCASLFEVCDLLAAGTGSNDRRNVHLGPFSSLQL